MQGVEEFVEFCHDEFWDLTVTELGSYAVLWIHRDDPRRERIWNFLSDVRDNVGIAFIDGDDNSIVVYFDPCGAQWPSMIFRVRSTYDNPVHILSAVARDAKDNREILRLYALQGKRFQRGFTHPAIRQLQWALTAHGFSCPEDGVWTWRTKAQLWRFRRRHHLFTPPFIDSHTLDALEV